MCKTRWTLDDVGGSLSVRALVNFIRHLGVGSALYGELNPDASEWKNGENQSEILADIFDLIQSIAYAYEIVNTKKDKRGSIKKPSPYPRPGAKDDGMEHYGKDPIAVCDFDSWWAENAR